MPLISDSDSLAAFCRSLAGADFITVDTEFMRDNTFWPRLCVVQIAGADDAMAIDTLDPGIDLGPLIDLLMDRNVLKVFHAARQDVEIFFHMTGSVPAPLFDTQVAAMVCGFGDSVGYETLVRRLAGAQIDKSSRFTDWSLRPLTAKQVSYALDDVIHLRKVYAKLRRRLEKSGRSAWLEEEMAVLTDPATYRLHPEDSWKRLKTRSHNPRYLAILREVAAWREREAQRRDLPRNRVLRDEALFEIAAHRPHSVKELARTRGLSRKIAEGPLGEGALAAVRRGESVPEDAFPTPSLRAELPRGLGPVVTLLKVLLQMKAEAHDVAARLIASSEDLGRIAAEDEPDVSAMRGWRYELFGRDARALKNGEVALAVEGKALGLVQISDGAAKSRRPPAKTENS